MHNWVRTGEVIYKQSTSLATAKDSPGVFIWKCSKCELSVYKVSGDSLLKPSIGETVSIVDNYIQRINIIELSDDCDKRIVLKVMDA